MASRAFGLRQPAKEHLMRSSGLAGEITDLRKDLDAAFEQSENQLGSNIVVWAPYADPSTDLDPKPYYTEWADAVAALQKMTYPETFLYIQCDPYDGPVTIPYGVWQLNNTTIVGTKRNASLDAGYRAEQDKLDVYMGYDNVVGRGAHIKGCVGLKDMYIRGNPFLTQAVTTNSFVMPAVGNAVSVDIDTSENIQLDIGTVLYIGGAGYFRLDEVLSPASISVKNLGYAGNTSPTSTVSSGQDVIQDYSVFLIDDQNVEMSTFTLDNVDFRFNAYDFGTMHVDQGGVVAIYLKNGASIRWYSLFCNQYAIIQSDGSPCWIGNSAFYGEGTVDVIPAGATELHPVQPGMAFWYVYQDVTYYKPNNSSHWSSDPASVTEALDRMAALLYTLNTSTPIP